VNTTVQDSSLGRLASSVRRLLQLKQFMSHPSPLISNAQLAPHRPHAEAMPALCVGMPSRNPRRKGQAPTKAAAAHADTHAPTLRI
jgi:hypothetical protein